VDRNRDDENFPAWPVEGLDMNNFYEELIIAGFGGQGIILAGKLLAQTAMKCGKEVTYMPSYGAEVRGGTANCMVVIADEPIASPMVNNPNCAIVMNKASLEKFAGRIKKGGLLILNSSQIDVEPQVDGLVEVIKLPADELANKVGSGKSSNMVALGAYLEARGLFGICAMSKCMEAVLAGRLHKTIEINTKALEAGAEFVKRQCIVNNIETSE
jgi:2-oxoglutarate ferredoxin oxidoreductase subunit gamma